MKLFRQERGVTGLETAIILIAFVVVASVFAFTVLSTGIFSAERGKETIHAGLTGARSSMELKGSIVSNGVANQVLSTGDSAWTQSANVTATADTTDKKEGTGSADLAVGASFTTGLAAYSDLSATVDLSSIDSVKLWVKYGTTTAAGDLELILDDSAACGSSLENIDLPVLVANTWTSVTVGISDNSDMTAIKCVGLNLTTDDGAQTANLDNIVAQGQATSVLITLANALEGEPIDLSEPGDSDANGLSDSDSTHTLIVTYTDKNQGGTLKRCVNENGGVAYL
jgi:flagellin FlaB